MGRGGGQSALRHQRAELRPLQNLRHQGPQPEHHLGAARRRWRAELSEYVTSSLRAERSNPARPRGLDCFVASLLAMTGAAQSVAATLPRFRRPCVVKVKLVL